MNHSRLNNSESGVALLELALVLPFLLFMLIAGLESTRALQTDKAAITLSREAANLVLRRCDTQIDAAGLGACVVRQSGEINAAAAAINPNAQVRISMFGRQGAAVTTISDGRAPFSGAAFNFSHRAADVANNIREGIGPIDATFFDTRNFLIVAESYVPHQPLFPGLGDFLGAGSLEGYYDATIF